MCNVATTEIGYSIFKIQEADRESEGARTILSCVGAKHLLLQRYSSKARGWARGATAAHVEGQEGKPAIEGDVRRHASHLGCENATGLE